MKTVIGLFWSDEDIKNTLDKLEEGGFGHEDTSTPHRIARERLARGLGHPIARSLA